jgi:hypothetical protein
MFSLPFTLLLRLRIERSFSSSPEITEKSDDWFSLLLRIDSRIEILWAFYKNSSSGSYWDRWSKSAIEIASSSKSAS